MTHDIVAIDVGNTNATFGLMRGRDAVSTFDMPSKDGDDDTAIGEACRRLSETIRGSRCETAVIASVNPSGLARAQTVVQRCLGLKAMLLKRDAPVPIRNLTEDPDAVGADRLVNALAAYTRARASAIVIDFGTAVSFDVVNASGAYLGGVIAPGIGLAMRALSDNTALLPLVKPAGRPAPIGRTTIEAINSGVFHGYIGLARNIVAELSRALGERPHIVATGGDGAYLANDIGCIDEIVPNLTLEGIRIAYDSMLNRNASA